MKRKHSCSSIGLKDLVEEIGTDEWMHENLTMGIITPYRAQVDYLHKLAEASSDTGAVKPAHYDQYRRCISGSGARCDCD